MAVPSNTIQNVARVGVREDLDDKIAELFPDEAPFMKAIGRSKANNTYTEWQTDGLAAANEANAAIQGDDLANAARANTTRVGTHTQIFTKVVGSSTTVEWTNKAGRRSEMAREMMKSGREIRTDQEKRFVGNYASVAAAAGVAGLTAGAQAWLTSNVSRGGTGANGGFSAGIVAAATNGTQRAYTEALLKTVLLSIWNAGGNAKMVITNGAQKQAEAAFAGLAVNRIDNSPNGGQLTIVAGADVYQSDFGKIAFVPDRFADARSALVIDPEYWDIAVGDPLTTRDMAVTGLANRKYMSTEVALRCLNQAASGVVADLT
ncbi:MAG: SU10 major capsid protein [Beijerinckiaceae bacterium]